MNNLSKILFLLVVTCTVNQLNAQSVDAVLEHHFKTIGQEYLLDVQTITTKGTLRQGGVELQVITYNKRPNKFRIEAKLQDLIYVEVFDGQSGWLYNPVVDEGKLQKISEEDLETLKDRADIDGLLFNYKEKGFSIELLNPVYVGKILTDVIKLTKPNGSVILYFIDSETGVIIRSRTKLKINGAEKNYETIYSNYKRVNNILFPFSVDVFSSGELIMEYDFTSVELNVELEDYRFETPQSLKEQNDKF